jgi:hypothetical protein
LGHFVGFKKVGLIFENLGFEYKDVVRFARLRSEFRDAVRKYIGRPVRVHVQVTRM